MLSLYFNTAIPSNEVLSKNASLIPTFFHLGFYPLSFENAHLTNFDKLLLSIKSLKPLPFKTAVFNIQMHQSLDRSIVEEAIKDSVSADEVLIRWSRPCTKSQWIGDIEGLLPKFGSDPVVVQMNHDHPLNNKYADLFLSQIDKCFCNVESDKPLMSFSHGPEMLSGLVSLNSSPFNIKFQRKTVSWLDSLYVMRMSSLCEAFSKMVVPSEDFYVGRIDWSGVYLKPVEFDFFISQIPYFYHLDGYAHVSGINVYQHLLSNREYLKCQEELYFLLYSEWFSHYFLFLFNAYRKGRSIRKTKKALIESIEHYFCYARFDGDSLDTRQKEVFKSLVFSMFNSFIEMFSIESEVAKKKKSISKFLPFKLKVILKNLVGQYGFKI